MGIRETFVPTLFKSKHFPRTPQIIASLLFAYMLYATIFGAKEAGSFGKALMWNVWWPIVPIAILLIGRGAWCGVFCPLGAACDAIEKRNLQKKFAMWLRPMFVLTFIFLAVTWYLEAIKVEDSIIKTGYFFLALLTIVVVLSIVFADRAWCRFLCPVGVVFGFFSKLSFTEVRPTLEKCKQCKTIECVKGVRKMETNGGEKVEGAYPRRSNEDLVSTGEDRGCPMFFHPMTMDSNRLCVWCARCFKNCPYDSIHIRWRIPGKELITSKNPILGESLFVIAFLGFLSVMEGRVKDFLIKPLNAAFPTLAAPLFERTVSYTVVFIGIIAAFIGVYYVIGRLCASLLGKASEWRETSARLGFIFLPMGLFTMTGHQFPKLYGFVNTYITELPKVANFDPIRYSIALIGVIWAVYLAFTLPKTISNKGAIATTIIHLGLIGFIAFLLTVRFLKIPF